MALPLQRIYQDNPGALPAQYTLPPNLDMEFGSSRARINGAGAASSFIVVLELLASDGRIMVQSRIDQEFAVGDTGALTWAPFLRRRTTQQGTVDGAGLWQAVANPATIPDGFINPVPLVWDTVVFDSGGYFSVANPTRLTAPSDGIYLGRAQMGYNVTVAVSVSLEIVTNGTFGAAPHWKGEIQFSETGQYHAVPNLAAIFPAQAGDYFEVYCLQKSGAARAIDPTASWFELIRLGDSPVGTQYGL